MVLVLCYASANVTENYVCLINAVEQKYNRIFDTLPLEYLSKRPA